MPHESAAAATVPDLATATDPALSQKKRDAVGVRWAAVREERQRWIDPFHDLTIAAALDYLKDLQSIWEEGGAIINERINSDKHIKCSGPKCGRMLDGLRPNGMPKWVAKMDLKDERNPTGKDGKPRTVPHYFCSELCYNAFMRRAGGALGNESKK